MNELLNNNQLQERKGVREELFKDYIEYLQASPKTVETYVTSLKVLAKYLSDNNISQPTYLDLINYKKWLEHHTEVDIWGNEVTVEHKPTTITNYIVATRLFFTWTGRNGLYPNIAEGLKGEKLSREHKKDYLTAEQMKTILDNMPNETEQDKRNYAITWLMATCGLRTIEVVRANVEDLTNLGNRSVLRILGKGKTEKTNVNVPKEVEIVIRDYLKTRSSVKGNEPLFISTSHNSKGGRLTTRTIREIVKSTFRANGYDSERLTAHSLRHTAITLSLIGGEELTEAQTFARHQNLNTTMIYNHAIDEAKNTCSQTAYNLIKNG